VQVAGLLDHKYQVRIDGISEQEWTDVVSLFDDALLYQTWAFGAVHSGRDSLSHLILSRGDEIVAAAQVRIKKLPLVRAGIAYVTSGPLWRRSDMEADPEVFRQIIIALRDEYVKRRGLLLRVVPNEMTDTAASLQTILEEENYTCPAPGDAHRTILINLRLPPDELRKGIRRRSRRCLTLSEKNEFEIVHGCGLDLYDEFIDAYKELVARKKFSGYVDIYKFRRIMEKLPDSHKMLVMICRHQGRLVSTIVSSGIGKTVMGVFGATNMEGRKLNANFYLLWQEWAWWRERGYEWFDFGGINPEKNPGSYHFKASLLGSKCENGREVQQLGHYDASEGLLSPLAVRSGEVLRSCYKDVIKANYRKLKSKIGKADGSSQ
jgi:lipid II:glycine glycyltransferase (peptidoglycan interpeptide bridge formation enzyme)